jgi:hypothetical protein
MMMYFLNDCKPLGDDPTSNPIQVRKITRVENCAVDFFVIPFYLQSALVHLANCIKTCRRVLSSAPL